MYKNANTDKGIIQKLCDLTLKQRKEVLSILEKHGYEVDMHRNTNAKKLKFRHLYDQGYTDAEISKYLLMSESTIRNWREEQGLLINFKKRACCKQANRK